MTEVEKSAKKAKHPKYYDLLVDAFKKMNVPRSGISRISIVNYIMANYEDMNKAMVNRQITNALKKGVETGQFKQVTGSGANGSFKLGDQLKKEEQSEKNKAARAEKRAEKDALKESEKKDKPVKEAKPAKIKKAKSKIDMRKSGVSLKKINTKKLQRAAELIQENKMDKPKKGEKLHVSILINPKPKKSKKATKEKKTEEAVADETPVESNAKTSKKKEKSPVKATNSEEKPKTKATKTKASPAKKPKESPAKKAKVTKETTEKTSPAKKTDSKKTSAKKAK